MAHKIFPIDRLTPQTGHIAFNAFGASIEIPINPFDLPDHGRVETSLRLDRVTLPSPDPAVLTGQTLRFPINPDQGYIDGSIYIGGAHHPVDVSQINFCTAGHSAIIAQFAARVMFTFEGLSASESDTFDDIDWNFTTRLAWPSQSAS